MPVGGSWSTQALPIRSGTYINFIAAVQAAVAPGTAGTVALIGTADWGPANEPTGVSSLAEADSYLNGVTSGGALRDAISQAFSGFDQGGATAVYFYRAVGSAGAAASVTLNDTASTPVAALQLKAVQPGIRANNWSVTVSANVANPSNSDIFIYENGVLLEQFANVAGGTNDAFAQVINAAESPFVTATVQGSTGRTLASIVGTPGGAGGFTGGNSGATLQLSDYASAQNAFGDYIFDVITLANVTDGPTQEQFVAWLEEYNATSGYRAFGVIGGEPDETLSTALARSAPDSGDDCDLVNVGATDLLRLSDGAVLGTAYLAPTVAGAIAGAGLARALTGMTMTGYQVNVPLSQAGYVQAVQGGVLCFRQDDPVTASVEEGVTTQVTSNTTNRPVAHTRIANVAIDHFIANQIAIQGRAERGSLRNTGAGVLNFIGNVLTFLQALETENILQSGSEVALDPSQNNTGDSLFIQVGITYIAFVEKFFFTVQVQ